MGSSKGAPTWHLFAAAGAATCLMLFAAVPRYGGEPGASEQMELASSFGSEMRQKTEKHFVTADKISRLELVLQERDSFSMTPSEHLVDAFIIFYDDKGTPASSQGKLAFHCAPDSDGCHMGASVYLESFRQSAVPGRSRLQHFVPSPFVFDTEKMRSSKVKIEAIFAGRVKAEAEIELRPKPESKSADEGNL